MKKLVVAVLGILILLTVLSNARSGQTVDATRNAGAELATDAFDQASVDIPVDMPSLAPGDYTFELRHNGSDRYYLLHVPDSYQGPSASLVLAFHGGAGNAEGMAAHYSWVQKSNAEGFVVAFPNGSSRFPNGKIATWNAGNCCAYALTSEADDVGFIEEVVEDITTKVAVSSVFATGMSNGGMFSYRLACDTTGTFDAIAAVAGTDNYDSCRPSDDIPVMHIHSLQDQHVLYDGGCGPDCVLDRGETEFVSVAATIDKWVQRNSCIDAPQRVFESDKAYCDVYAQCAGGVEVKSCTTTDGGHSWPGVTSVARGSTDGISQALNATDEIWDFFTNYR